MQTIKVDTDELSDYGKKFIEVSQTFNGVHQEQFNSLIGDVSGAWQGADATQYVNVMKENYTLEFDELEKSLEMYGEFLQKASEAYNEVDSTFAGKTIDV